jgi:hypothetical protein
MTSSALIGVIRRGIAAGTAGGIAEVLWISTYTAATGASAATLARGVTSATGMDTRLAAAPVASGIFIHMMLAAALGVALACAWRVLSTHWSGRVGPFALVLPILACVWAINFFLVLPLISPAFVSLVPYPVSLVSKLLFGLAAAAVLRQHARRADRTIEQTSLVRVEGSHR